MQNKIVRGAILLLIAAVYAFSVLIFAACADNPKHFPMEELSLPLVIINTEDGKEIKDKENYIACEISVRNAEEQYEFEAAEGKIKGRGNSTWQQKKKPYKFKFSEKVDLFGNGAAKTWTLIANYSDKSLLRNRMAYAVGDLLGLEYNNQTQPVDLYLNGEYEGVYLVCEQTETGKTRVNIEDGINPEDQGFLVEYDQRAADEGTEGLDWFGIDGHLYAVKGPETDGDGYSEEVTAVIRQFLTGCYNTVKDGSYAEIERTIDVESFAKTYIVSELFKQVDVGTSSWYLYRDRGGKLKSGPLWDFDLSCGNDNEVDGSRDTDGLWAAEKNVWYKMLLEHDQFKALVADILQENGQAILDKVEEIAEEAKECSDSYERNFERWRILKIYVWPNPIQLNLIHTWEGQVDFVLDFLEESMKYMLSVYVG